MLFSFLADSGWKREFLGIGSDKLRKLTTLRRTEVTLAPALVHSGCQRTAGGAAHTTEICSSRLWRLEARRPGTTGLVPPEASLPGV